MPHQVEPEGTIHHPSPAGRPPSSVSRTYDDWPVAASSLPILTGNLPAPPQVPVAVRAAGQPQGPMSAMAGVERLRAFIDAVLEMHRVLTDRFIPMCSCGSPARHCPIVKAEHEVLGMAMPFTFESVRPPYYEV